jgi:hypothetical protein
VIGQHLAQIVNALVNAVDEASLNVTNQCSACAAVVVLFMLTGKGEV